MTARIRCLVRHVNMTKCLPIGNLLAIIEGQQFSLLYRLAALRHLIAVSPVTRNSGMVYLERKRLVRLHYQI